MSPKEQNQQKSSKESPNQTQSSSEHSIDQIVDSIALGQQTDQRSIGSDSLSNTNIQSKPPLSRLLMKNHIFGYEMPFDLISAAFASTVAIGGVIGYVKASQY